MTKTHANENKIQNNKSKEEVRVVVVATAPEEISTRKADVLKVAKKIILGATIVFLLVR